MFIRQKNNNNKKKQQKNKTKKTKNKQQNTKKKNNNNKNNNKQTKLAKPHAPARYTSWPRIPRHAHHHNPRSLKDWGQKHIRS